MCKIALAPSGAFALTIPSPSGGERTIELPITLGGLKILEKVLRKQADLSAIKTIGTEASPIAYDIAKYLAKQAEDRATRIARRAAIADEILDLAGITLEL